VQYNHELTGIEYTETGVIAHFADGTSEAGTTLVGADGGGSFVRRELLGPRGEAQAFPDYEMVNMAVRYPAEQAKFIAESVAGYVDYGVHPKGVFFMLLCKTGGQSQDAHEVATD
jgi:2-polyprenyl-6-methoxyphenol hydroxylase-like FAD-dependent oxidoreductase